MTAREPVKVLLNDGREYRLRYPFPVLQEIKQKLGVSFLKGSGFGDIDEDKLPELLWYGMRSENPDLTMEQVAAKMDGDMLQDLLSRMMLAATGVDPLGATKNE